MKKVLFLTVVAVAMSACSNDVDLGLKDANKQSADNAIGFQVLNKNMSRAKLEDAKHYNFGVWAYKNTDQINNIMANYLVGYFGTNKGYLYDSDKQTTYGGTTDNYTDALSLWSYEGLGTSQYVNTTNNNYYRSDATDKFYLSNLDYQYLRYWDKTSANTEFCAYAPYIKSASDPVTFTKTDGNGGTMTFPGGSIAAGYDDASKFEYLCAYANVIKDNYGKDVQLKFEHMNSKIRILFYEDVAGYDVRMLDLKGSAGVGVLAVPTKLESESTSYTYSEDLAKTAGATVKFTNTPSITFNLPTTTTSYKLNGSNEIDGSSINNKALVFKAPTATALQATKELAKSDAESWSETVYYGIPHNTSCGLTFRVSFELKSTSGEIINVYDAGVHVDAANCVWEAGKSYTYIFKITKNTNGTTDSSKDDPKVDPKPGDKALFPIVFDGITINDWTPDVEYEYNIN